MAVVQSKLEGVAKWYGEQQAINILVAALGIGGVGVAIPSLFTLPAVFVSASMIIGLAVRWWRNS